MRNTTTFARLISSMLLVTAVVWAPRSALSASPEDILVVANKGVSVDSVTLAELRSIYLGQKKSWKKGGKIKPINAKPKSQLRRVFRQKVLGLDGVRETNYWQVQKVRKTGTPPPELGNTLAAVTKISGSVSYVFRKDFRQDLAKVVLVLPGKKVRFKIIVHPDLPVTGLTVPELRQIFLKEKTKWPGGETIIPTDQSSRSSVRDVFTREVHGKSISAINSLWQQRIFSGKGIPPVQVNSDDEVVDYVVSHPGAIGYVSDGAKTGGAKVVPMQR